MRKVVICPDNDGPGIDHGIRAADAVLAYLDGDDEALERLSARFTAEFTDYEALLRSEIHVTR